MHRLSLSPLDASTVRKANVHVSFISSGAMAAAEKKTSDRFGEEQMKGSAWHPIFILFVYAFLLKLKITQ